MAILSSQIEFRPLNSATPYTSGLLHDMFPAGQVGAATDYAWCEVVNTHTSLTWTSPKVWLSIDASGATVAIAVADSVARAPSYRYPGGSMTGFTYSTPVTSTAGLALPTLPPLNRCLLAVRRTLTGASTAYPENNVLLAEGDSPL